VLVATDAELIRYELLEFEIFGYHKVFESPFFVYTLRAEQGVQLEKAFANGIESYNPSGRSTLVDAKDVVPLLRADAPLDVQITQWLHG
jgi:hypothetical protein